MVTSQKSLKKRSSVNVDKLENAKKPCGWGNSLSSTDSPTAVKAHKRHDGGRGRRGLQRQPPPCLQVLRQHKREYKGANLKNEYVGNGYQVVLSYFNIPETSMISCCLPQNNDMVFQDRKVTIRSPKTLEFQLVKQKRIANKSQVGFRALCHSVTARKL